MAKLFLKSRMAVIPVGTVLAYREAVGVSLAGGDSCEANARHSIHLGREDQAMPMN